MKTLCWNTDDAVWKHWNQVVDVDHVLVRVQSAQTMQDALSTSSEPFSYCFIYLADTSSSEQIGEVVAFCQANSSQNIVVFPSQANQTVALKLFSVGVSGQCAPYIGKEQLSLVLSVVDSGEIWGGKAFIQQLIMQSNTQSLEHPAALEGLSDREMAVAERIAKGLSNKQIANEMDITERTVKAHLTSIFKKTNTKDRLSLALLLKSSSHITD